MDVKEKIDDLIVDAAAFVIKFQQCSIPFIQRKLKIGYLRAERIVNQLEYFEIVGPSNGSRDRQVLKASS